MTSRQPLQLHGAWSQSCSIHSKCHYSSSAARLPVRIASSYLIQQYFLITANSGPNGCPQKKTACEQSNHCSMTLMHALRCFSGWSCTIVMATASFEGLRDGGNRADIYVCGVVRATVSLYRRRQLDHVNNRDGLLSSGRLGRHQTKAATNQCTK